MQTCEWWAVLLLWNKKESVGDVFKYILGGIHMYIGGQKDLQQLDQYTIEQLGLPGIVLMENAGNAVVQELVKNFPDINTRIVVLAGAGNNGGDGYVIARRLHDLGYINTLLCLTVECERLKGDAKLHFDVYVRREMPLLDLQNSSMEELNKQLLHAHVIVDALLGTGVNGTVREPFSDIISYVNKYGKYVVAVDIPSGLSADTGVVEGVAIKANQTISFALPKKGFFLNDGPRYIGHWQVVDISVSPSIVERLKLQLPKLITEEDVKQAIPQRPSNGHKGTFGHGLVIGGSRSYVGAPVYTARAAFQSGIGLVTLAVPESVYKIVAVQNPESLFLPLEEEGGHMTSTAFANIDWTIYKTIAIGPGMSRFESGEVLLRNLFIAASTQPIVVDADALYFLRNQMEIVKNYKGSVIVTPHPGEMATLLHTTVKEVEANRLQVAQQFAQEFNVYVLLKGHRSIIATPTGELWVNPRGNDSLGKGGSGDVLTGLILSLLAQGTAPEQALIAASFLHAKAGEEQGKLLSNYGVTPNDVIEGIRVLLKKFQ